MADQDPTPFGVGSLFWLTNEAIVAADLSTERIILWNPSAERIFGYSASEAIGKPLDMLVPAELKLNHHAGIARYRYTGEARLVGGNPVDVPSQRKDGTKIDVSLTLTALPEKPGGPFVLAIVRDVTEQKRQAAELERVNSAMKSFVATASHDLRTPLASVIGFANHLVSHGEEMDQEGRAEVAEAILRSGERASLLVDDLLTLSKIEASAIEVRMEPTPVSDVVTEAIQSLGIDADMAIPDGLSVFVDPDHLLRILTNFLQNARTYGSPPIGVVADVSGEWIEITVRDHGAGVSEDFRPRLFISFAREDARRASGSGLGLAIVKGLAEANKGAVVYKPEDPGSTFGVRLMKAQ